MDFLKKTSILSFSKKSFKSVAKDVMELAHAEKLKAHGDAVKIRLGRYSYLHFQQPHLS